MGGSSAERPPQLDIPRGVQETRNASAAVMFQQTKFARAAEINGWDYNYYFYLEVL